MTKYKSIRISEKAYKFLSEKATEERRSVIDTLDLFIELFEEVENDKERS